MKPMTRENLFRLSEDEIKQSFPFGATVTKEGRFRPAGEGEKDTVSLNELLKAKRKLIEPRRLMGKTGGYVENPAFALYTNPDPGEAVAAAIQRDFSREANVRPPSEPLHKRLERLEPVIDDPRRLKSLETRIERLERAYHGKAA